MARPNKYFSNIKPNFKKIEEMLIDMKESDVARFFEITMQSWKNYRKTYKEFDDLLRNINAVKVSKYRKNLRRLADGEYVQKKIKEYIRDENGKVIKEIETTYFPPSEKANNMLLSNIDESWCENPRELEIKKEELQIKKDNSFY